MTDTAVETGPYGAEQGDTFDPASMTWVFDEEALDWMLASLSTAVTCVMDLETTGLDEHATAGGHTNGGYPARVVLASLTLPQEDDEDQPTTWVVPLSHPDSPWLGRWREVLRRICQTIVDHHVPLVNQNVKFDARWCFAHTGGPDAYRDPDPMLEDLSGVDLSGRIVWDTQVSSHLLDETWTTSLKPRASRTFGVPRWDEHDLSTPGAAERVPLIELGEYAARDTYWDWKLARLHERAMYLEGDDEPETPEDVEHARLGRFARWCAMPMVASMTAVEQRGIRLDVEWCHEERTEHRSAVETLSFDLASRYGMDWHEASWAPTSHWFRAWTEAACEAGDLVVASLTPTGKPQWSKGVLVRQERAGSQVAADLLSLRSHAKKVEYLTSWLGYVTPAGLIHASYNLGRVITGRLSSSDPNMQQVTASLKPAFVPHGPGRVIAELDYSQIELRVAAFVSRCPDMLAAFQRGDDLHTMLASRITGKPLDEITPTERQAGKSANFGLLYMMGPYGFQMYAETVYGISFTPEESQAVHRAFYEQWSGIGPWHARTIQRARNTGAVVSPIGRVRRLPDIWDGNEQKAAFAERSAVNSPVQGFASDLMQIAAASIGGYLPGSEPVHDALIVGTVHDSLVVDVPQGRWEDVVQQCIGRMLGVGDVLKRMDCTLDVPLAVEAKVGTRWGLKDVGEVHG